MPAYPTSRPFTYEPTTLPYDFATLLDVVADHDEPFETRLARGYREAGR